VNELEEKLKYVREEAKEKANEKKLNELMVDFYHQHPSEPV
jgi:hypothetical protein